jgi:hypothetical protein
VTDYLQHRFTEESQKKITDYVSEGVKKLKGDEWKEFLYKDDLSIYIPSMHFRGAFINAGRELKVKRQKRSMKDWVISNIIVEPEKIYINKQEPDKIIKSYPRRKDGSRVVIEHPSFNAGLQVDFVIYVLSDMESETIYKLVEIAGKMYGAGARRRDMFGRFEVVKFE